MKNMYKLLLLVLSAISIFKTISLTSFSVNTDFQGQKVSNEETQSIIESLDVKFTETFPVIEKGFNCFDVNEDGYIALNFSNIRERNYIVVYNSSCEFKYCLSYNSVGSYGIQWDGNNIMIYSIRGEFAVIVDNSGNCMEIMKIPSNSVNHDYLTGEIFANRKKVSGIVYKAEALIINSSMVKNGEYVRLVKIFPNGKEIVVFENTFGIKFFYTAVVSVIVIFAILVLKLLLKKHKIEHN